MSNHNDPQADIEEKRSAEKEEMHRVHVQLQQNLDDVMAEVGHSTDVIVRRFRPVFDSHEIAVIYVAGLVENETIMNNVIDPLQHIKSYQASTAESIKQALTVAELHSTESLQLLLDSLYEGNTVVLIDGHAHGWIANSNGGDKRNVSEPATQTIIRGPRDSFTESITTNTALIRRKVKSPKLWLETFQLGEVTKTNVGVMYIHGIVKPSIVEEVKRRIHLIQIDGVLESGYIEEYIQESTFTVFPTIQNTDRPDTSAAALLEGRVVILVDGSPFVLIAPSLFTQLFQASEDYYQRWDISSLIRFLRYVAFAIALFAPSVYVAITTYHQEMIPSQLLFTLASQREGVPFPAFVEAFLMEVVFEILREAGIRMGRAIGTSVSIVGTLVIGQAAVEAGLVTAAMVIVVSSTAISNFVSPSYNLGISTRMLRFSFMALAASLGLYGVTIGIILLTLHLCHLTSFGIPYMSSLAPFHLEDQKDVLIRLPRWMMIKRPVALSNWNKIREQKDIMKTMLKKK